MIEIVRANSDETNFRQLVSALDSELDLRYGVLQKEYDKYNVIEFLDTVVIAFKNGTAIGCGCFKAYSDQQVEIKRMFVSAESRGSGAASLLLHELEKWALEKGFSGTILETGIRQPEAIRFYQKNGYSRIDNYGQYIGNENSVCMSKQLPRV